MTETLSSLLERMVDELTPDQLVLMALRVATIDPSLQISDYDQKNVGEVLQTGDWWGADMLRLIKRSDQAHRAMLSIPFASYVMALEDWEKSGGEVA